MIQKEVMTTRLKDIKNYLSEMETIFESAKDEREIVQSFTTLRALERDFQLIVDTMIDINTHIISREGLRVTDDFQSTFEVLGENKILPLHFALRIAPVVGLRNMIVHKYGKVDQKKFVNELRKGFQDFEKYIQYLQKWMKRSPKRTPKQ